MKREKLFRIIFQILKNLKNQFENNFSVLIINKKTQKKSQPISVQDINVKKI